jgi:hypothetical protein
MVYGFKGEDRRPFSALGVKDADAEHLAEAIVDLYIAVVAKPG